MSLKEKIQNKTATIAVVGLGWMGLPIAAIYANTGFNVIGYDIDEKLVDEINNKTLKRKEEQLHEILEKTVGKNFYATSDANELVKADIFSVIVPLIIKEDKSLDWSAIDNAISTIAEKMKENVLIVIHTTMPIYATRKHIKPILEKSGKKFFLAYSPIRAMTPHAISDMVEKYPRVIGAINEESLVLTEELLKTFFKNEIIKLKLEEAEATKLFEIIYRDVNIALANELSVYCDQLGLNYENIRKAANTVPAYNLHYAGPGVGGHCLPVYPYLLLNNAKEFPPLGLIRKAREINDWKPIYVVDKFEEKWKNEGKKPKRIAVLGFGYRPGIGEIRFSPAITIAKELKKRGYEVLVCDPYVDDNLLSKFGKVIKLEEVFENVDIMIVSTKHPKFDLKKQEAKIEERVND